MDFVEVSLIISKIMTHKLTIDKIFFYVENVGYLHVDEIYLYNEGINVHNNETNISEDVNFDDKLIIIK